MESYFHTVERVVSEKRVDFTSEQLSQFIDSKKPTELFNGMWSRSKPFIFITEYNNEGFLMYCSAWADKTPQQYTANGLYQFLKYQGLGDCFVNIKSEAEAWCDYRDTMYEAWKAEHPEETKELLTHYDKPYPPK